MKIAILALAAVAVVAPVGAAEFPVQRCINLADTLDAPVEGEWGPPLELGFIEAIAAAGFDTVRLPVQVSAHWDGERIEPHYLARIDEVVGWAEGLGLNVILDLHNFFEINDDPAQYSDEFVDIWAALGQHFSGHAPSLIFELLNEPTAPLTNDRLVPLYIRALDILRPSHPDRWIVAGGDDWNSIDAMLSLDRLGLPHGERDVRSFHYYVPWEFTHQQVPWINPSPPARRWDKPTELAHLPVDFAVASRAGSAILLGEFGAFEAIPQQDRMSWIRAVREAAENQAIGWCHWGFAATFKAWDTDTKAWEPGILDALMD